MLCKYSQSYLLACPSLMFSPSSKRIIGENLKVRIACPSSAVINVSSSTKRADLPFVIQGKYVALGDRAAIQYSTKNNNQPL